MPATYMITDMAQSPGELSLPILPLVGVNLRALTRLPIVPIRAGGSKFIARAAWLRIASMTGTLTVVPIVRIGNNGTFNNVCTVLTLTGAAVDRVFTLPLSPTLIAALMTTAISFDVSTAATGVTVLTCDVHLQGHFI